MRVRFAAYILFALASGSAAVAAPTTAAATKDIRSAAVGLSIRVPTEWRVSETDGRAVRFTAIGNDPVDVLAILRGEEPVPGDAAETHAKKVIERHKETAIGNGSKVVEQRACVVAGAAAHLVDLAGEAGGAPMRLVIVACVLDGREYKLVLIGGAKTVERVKAGLPDLLASIERLPATDKKSP